MSTSQQQQKQQQQQQQQRSKKPQSSGRSSSSQSQRKGNSSDGGGGNSRQKVSHYVNPKQHGGGGGRGGRGGRGRGSSYSYNNNSNSNSNNRSRGRGNGSRNYHGNAGQQQGNYRGGGGARQVLGPARPLPASYPGDLFFGTSSLIAQLDKMVMVVLQSDEHILGTLRSFDQFGNFVLEKAVRRFYEGKFFTDMPLGASFFIIRGENVEILGEVDEEKDAKGVEGGLTRMTPQQFQAMKKKKQAAAADDDEEE